MPLLGFCLCSGILSNFDSVLIEKVFSMKKDYSILSFSVISRITLHGLPTARLCGGIFFVTTLPAPITLPSPIVTPPQTTTLAANQQSFSIVTGFAYSRLYNVPSYPAEFPHALHTG